MNKTEKLFQLNLFVCYLYHGIRIIGLHQKLNFDMNEIITLFFVVVAFF